MEFGRQLWIDVDLDPFRKFPAHWCLSFLNPLTIQRVWVILWITILQVLPHEGLILT